MIQAKWAVVIHYMAVVVPGVIFGAGFSQTTVLRRRPSSSYLIHLFLSIVLSLSLFQCTSSQIKLGLDCIPALSFLLALYL